MLNYSINSHSFSGGSLLSRIALQAPCPCGSGKEYGQCCGQIHHCQLIHFPRGKRSNYRTLIEGALADLLKYARHFCQLGRFSPYTIFISISNQQLEPYLDESVLWMVCSQFQALSGCFAGSWFLHGRAWRGFTWAPDAGFAGTWKLRIYQSTKFPG